MPPSNRDYSLLLAWQAAVMGHSMGGHGALTLGLRNPQLYKSISAFSPICNPSQVPWGQKAFSGYLGDHQEEWKQYDATELVRPYNRRCMFTSFSGWVLKSYSVHVAPF